MGDDAKINPKGWKEEPMPLEFESISHGRIAFGFLNIETDMILLLNGHIVLLAYSLKVI
jgi:hypothetical protein